MPITVNVNPVPVNVVVSPQLATNVQSSVSNNNITVGNAIPSVDLSNYATIPYVDNISGDLNYQISNLNISGGGAGVISINSKSGILLLNGAGGISVYQNGQSIYVSGSGILTSVDLNGLISTGQSDLRYYPLNNPNQYSTSGDINNLSGYSNITFATVLALNSTGANLINYINNISGELYSQIIGGGGSSGVSYLNSLAGSINLISSKDYFSFNNVGNNINIDNKPQNLTIYRNSTGQITGVQKNIELVRIYRNLNDKITGIYYNNYYKKVLLDNSDNITGVNVIYI